MNSVIPTTVEALRLRAFTSLSGRFSGDRVPGSRKEVKVGHIELVGFNTQLQKHCRYQLRRQESLREFREDG